MCQPTLTLYMFFLKIKTEDYEIATKALKRLIIFATSILCESVFLIVKPTKTRFHAICTYETHFKHQSVPSPSKRTDCLWENKLRVTNDYAL